MPMQFLPNLEGSEIEMILKFVSPERGQLHHSMNCSYPMSKTHFQIQSGVVPHLLLGPNVTPLLPTKVILQISKCPQPKGNIATRLVHIGANLPSISQRRLLSNCLFLQVPTLQLPAGMKIEHGRWILNADPSVAIEPSPTVKMQCPKSCGIVIPPWCCFLMSGHGDWPITNRWLEPEAPEQPSSSVLHTQPQQLSNINENEHRFSQIFVFWNCTGLRDSSRTWKSAGRFWANTVPNQNQKPMSGICSWHWCGVWLNMCPRTFQNGIYIAFPYCPLSKVLKSIPNKYQGMRCFNA